MPLKFLSDFTTAAVPVLGVAECQVLTTIKRSARCGASAVPIIPALSALPAAPWALWRRRNTCAGYISKYSISFMILENSIYTYDINTRLVLTSFQGYKYRILKPQERSNIWIHPAHVFWRRHSAHGAAVRAVNAGVMGTGEAPQRAGRLMVVRTRHSAKR